MDAPPPRPGTPSVDTGQPWLHDLQIAVHGPTTVLSDAYGQVGPPGTGLFVDDRRVLCRLAVRLDGRAPTGVAAASVGATSEFWAAARHLGRPGPDPTVEVHQVRTVSGRGLLELLRVTSRAETTVRTTLEVRLAGDGADIAAVKTGGTAPPLLTVTGGDQLGWRDERHRTTVETAPAPDRRELGPAGAVLGWDLVIPPHRHVDIELAVVATAITATAFDAPAGEPSCDWEPEEIAGRTADPVLAQTLRVSLTDLRHLCLADPEDTDDIFVAAGTPWYLTLFGRDSLWAARMMLPLSPRLALGTLRTLARRQADTDDVRTAAETGKILHEVRRTAYHGGSLDLPTVYYGTVDATPLWVVLLAEAYQAGLSEQEVGDLVPHLHAALDWMRHAVQRSPDGFLRYLDRTGTGLSNQGWKDSGDSMRRSDGSLATAPIALLEAQAYAVQAARGAAGMLAALGQDDPTTDWHRWADDLADRVRDRFWVGPDDDRYLAMALDADGEPIDGVGSNMGHALGTGLLTDVEAALVVDRMMRPDLLRTFGIGTLSRDNPAYNPIGYHTGSVWTHDTAIAMLGMSREGFPDEARILGDALLRLAVGSEFRFPELCGGEPVGRQPVPYPASCRPQGWSAASAAALLEVLSTG